MSLRGFASRGLARLPPGPRRQILHRLGRYAPWEVGFDFTPPMPRPGEETGPPDFVGIGMQKAGTTWWFDLLLQHPGISSHPEVHKERHFFDRFGARSMGASDVTDYHGWFPRPVGTITGEWTPDYLAYPWVPALMQRAAPDARLLVLLRDPVERFRSGLDHDQRAGHHSDGRSIADAMQRGYYHRALAEWSGYFARQQFLVLQFERCVLDIQGQLDRTCRHLGLPPHRASSSAATQRPRSEQRPPLDDELRQRLVDLYADDVSALVADRPDIDLTLWPNFAHLAVEPGPSDVDSGADSGDAGSVGDTNSPTTRR
jgi:hypothetical protein